jgi:electron transport complex protein RnfA
MSILNGFFSAVGFAIAIVILASIREKMEYNKVPEAFQGGPLVLLAAGLMAMAFNGFAGLM